MADRRIRIIDFETTGMEPPAVVIEYGLCDLADDGSGWKVSEPRATLYGAERIPPEVRAVHHIGPAEIAGLAPFDPASLWSGAQTCGVAVVAAHNLAFEARFYGEAALPVLCTLKAALRVWPEAPAHNNGTLRYWLEDRGLIAPDHAKTQPPHRAGPDAYVTAHILKALLEAGASGQDMVAWAKEPRFLPRCPIGDPWRGKPWAEVDDGFVRWITTKQGMDPEIVWNARRELERRAGR